MILKYVAKSGLSVQKLEVKNTKANFPYFSSQYQQELIRHGYGQRDIGNDKEIVMKFLTRE